MSVISLTFNMSRSPAQHPEEARFLDALEFYKGRQGAIFISPRGYWDGNVAPHRELAIYLAKAGLKTIWFDGESFIPRRHSATLNIPQLKISSLFSIPNVPNGVKRFTHRMQLLRAIRSAGKRPLIWIVGFVPEDLQSFLPYIDVVSIGDDPYLYSESAASRARLIVCQNQFARDYFETKYPNKVRRSYPPLEVNESLGDPPIRLPLGFPEEIVGVVGDFDPALLEYFVMTLKEWGILYLGNPRAEILPRVENLKHFSNFHAVITPDRIGKAVWKQLKVCCFLWRDVRLKDGAFPLESLDAFANGVPVVMTEVPAVADLNGIVFTSRDGEGLVTVAIDAIKTTPQNLAENFHYLKYEMSPRTYLSRVAEYLSDREKERW